MVTGAAVRTRLRNLDAVTRDVLVYCAVFALLRFWATLGGAPIRYPDSDSYYQLNFLGHDLRLWTVPLIYKPLFSDEARVVVQILLGIVCWSALALAVSRSLKTALVARLGAVLILLIGLCVQVVAWDQIILSESIALSLTALLIASLLCLRLRRSTGSLIGFVVVLTLWIFTRQLQAAVYIPIAVVGIIWILARGWRRRSSVLLACSLAVLAVWAGYVATQAKPIIATNAYAYVHPPRNEGTSPALLQAMGYANCIVSSDIVEAVEVAGDAAITFVSGDPADLARQLERVLADPELAERYRRLAVERVRAEYSWDDVAAKHRAVYERVLGTG